MPIKGLTGDLAGVVANSNDKGAMQSLSDSLTVNSPLSEAQRRADLLGQLKQRRPIVFEYIKDAESRERVDVQLYINPERMSASNQKIISKQITRGGIFYHHWGEDSWHFQITGTTGFSAMKGIQQLEEIYQASGTLLAYQNFGHKVTDSGVVELYQVIDYKDPIDIMMKTTSTVNKHQVKQISKRLSHFMKESKTPHLKGNYKLVHHFVKSYRNAIENEDTANSISAGAVSLYSWAEEYKKKNKGSRPSFNSFYQQGIKIFKQAVPGLNSDLQLSLAHQHAMSEYVGEGGSIFDPMNMDIEDNTRDIGGNDDLIYGVHKIVNDQGWASGDTRVRFPVSPDNDTAAQTSILSASRKKILTSHLKDLNKFYTKEAETRDKLFGYTDDIQDELYDKWRPRKVICYFENRAYIGHFENFTYNRVAQTPLISYELRFVVEKQIIGK